MAFVIEDIDNEIFGSYCETEISQTYVEWQQTDDKSFQFNLQSKNNRLDKPMKFEIKDLKDGGIKLYEKSYDDLIELGNIYLNKENSKNQSYCYQNENNFNYHGIENAVCGKTWINGGCFTPKRILVIQME